jgi:curved DNA-binding protein CbpA
MPPFHVFVGGVQFYSVFGLGGNCRGVVVFQRVIMKTLYDIIGALPDDDAEDLRAAFRKAVKANHPDLNPGNPEAPQTFRRIVRANAILSDERQREAYDRLLEVARQQQRRKPTRSIFSAGIRRLGFDAMASAVASVVFIAGYLLLKPVDRLPLASAHVTEISRREPAQTAAVRSTELSSQERTNPGDKLEDVGADMKLDVNAPALKEPTERDSISAAVTVGSAPASDVSPARESGPKDVKYYRERGISAYRSGDLYIALANFDLAIRQDPACSDCYVDRGIVLHRMGDLKGAFSDVAEAKRIDALNRKKTLSDASAR